MSRSATPEKQAPEWECPWLVKGCCELHATNGLGCYCGQANRQDGGPNAARPAETSK